MKDAKEDFKAFDPNAFISRREDYTKGVHIPPETLPNPANSLDWYVDLETDCWAYAADAYDGMAQEAYGRSVADISTGLSDEEVFDIYKTVFPKSAIQKNEMFLRKWGYGAFPDTHLLKKIPARWRTGNSAFAHAGKNRDKPHMTKLFDAVPDYFAKQPEW